jgi:plastocyanin
MRPVTIKNFEFIPLAVTIAAGGIIRWTNADVANHQITTGVVEADRPRPDGRVSSPLLFRGDAFTATFRNPGEYPYYCGVHPFMRGSIVVK